jgi:hypothetical protein
MVIPGEKVRKEWINKELSQVDRCPIVDNPSFEEKTAFLNVEKDLLPLKNSKGIPD